MILRGLAIFFGLPLLLIGLLASVAAVCLIGQPGPQGGPPPIVGQVIVAVFAAIVAAMGGLLCWVGFRQRSASTASAVPVSGGHIATPMEATAPACAASVDSATAAYAMTAAASPVAAGIAAAGSEIRYSGGDAVYAAVIDEDLDPSAFAGDEPPAFQIGTSGKLIGKCGPNLSGQLHYYVIDGILIAVGFALMIGLQVAPGAAKPENAAAVGLWLGGGLVSFGIVLLASQLLRAPQVITLYDDRLEEERGSKSRSIRLADIISLHLQEFYEHRFAPQTFLVTLTVNGQGKLKFSTALGGDAQLIVSCLADIVPDVQYREFVA